jgi:penicillin amidase
MKIVKKDILCSFLIFILVVVVAASVFYLKPKYEGEVALKHSKRNHRIFWWLWVSHIYAATNKDAMTALGYVHAQDRLWQMELMRRIAPDDFRRFSEKWH